MSTYEVAYSNTTTDLISVVPDLEVYDQKKLITNWTSLGNSLYRADSVGYISAMFKNGKELAGGLTESAATYSDSAVNTDETFVVGDTTLSVTDASDSDIVVGQVIRLASSGEKMLIIAESSNDLTVVRGLFDTSQGQQSTGADIYVAAGILLDQANEWCFDGSSDSLFLYSSSDPNEDRMEAGVDWETLKTRVNNEAAERIRSFVPFPIVSRKGVGTASAASRDHDWIIIKSNALLTCSSLVRPLNQELADELEKRVIDAETELGLLDQLVAGKYRLWNQGERQEQLLPISTDGSTTGDIVDFRGTPTVDWDLIRIKINTAGTFTAGSASGVKFDSYVGDSTSLKISQVANAETIDGSFQNVGHGMSVRFSPGVYNSTSDEWQLEVSGMQDNPKIKTARLWR